MNNELIEQMRMLITLIERSKNFVTPSVMTEVIKEHGKDENGNDIEVPGLLLDEVFLVVPVLQPIPCISGQGKLSVYFSITKEVQIPGNRDFPPETDIAEIDVVHGVFSTATRLMGLLFERRYIEFAESDALAMPNVD